MSEMILPNPYHKARRHADSRPSRTQQCTGAQAHAEQRYGETFALEHSGADFTVTAGHYPDGSLGEIFINAAHANSLLDALASDAAIALSFALQHGADLAAIKAAMKRDSRGEPSSPIGAALDKVTP